MNQIRHFIWRAYDEFEEATQGRVAVLVTDTHIHFRQIGGKMAPAKLKDWYEALVDAFPSLEKTAREDARQVVTLPWRVERHRGMSGCVDYKLRELKSREWRDQPVRASIHITMAAKLNDFRLRLGHFYALFQEGIKDQEAREGYLSKLTLYISEFYPPEIVETDWNLPFAETENDNE